MRARWIILPALAAATVGLGCAEGAPPADAGGPEAPATSEAGVVDLAHAPRPEIALRATPSVAFGSIDGSATDGFAAVVSGTRLSDGSFVLLDRYRDIRRLVVVDAAGRFVRELGRVGEGPGEFDYPQMVMADADGGVATWDARRGRLIRYGVDGEVRADTRLGAGTTGVVALDVTRDLPLAVVEENPPDRSFGRQDNVARLVRLPRGDTEPDVLAEFPGLSWHLTEVDGGVRLDRPWYYPRVMSAFNRSGLWTATGVDWTLVLRSADDGRILGRVRLDDDVAPFPRDSVENVLPDAPDVRPPLAALEIDRDGRIWIGLRDLPIERLPSGMGEIVSDWIVLDETGRRVVGEVSLPPRRRLLEASAHGVLTVTADGEYDTPIVEWWEFAP